ncbi:MAG TPA: hypothetical protein VM531_06890 [Sphingomicrobium sp.]|jgi:hypothetical protein|nr:hypothetical protein [Sphingomicrobium sp.]
MSNPNRVMANSHRVQNSTYDCFPNARMAGAYERAMKEQGFKTRSSWFRVGPRGGNKRSYRVSVYWMDGPGPDTAAARKAAFDAC